ncbi:MAG: DUF4011 domain-containing protein [Clostridia bacterium]|nr:DUF4011 domain-containing protein [Clostridia bacterium]
MDAVFQKWCDKLLDTGKGNRLINFKDSKLRTIDIIEPSYKEIFSKISAGQTLSFYEVDNFIRRLKDEEIDADVSENLQKDEGKFDKISKEQILESVTPLLGKNEVLSFKKGFTLRRILGSIKKIANSCLMEKGINILYMAFGFLTWKESEVSEYKFKSPLVLIPITIENESNTLPFTVKHYEDEITTNPTLLYKMEQEFGIKLPIFQDEQHAEESLEEYLQRVDEIALKHEWTVSNNVSIGTFSFLKINMYQDLINNEKCILSNSNVKKLLNRNDETEQQSDYVDCDVSFKKDEEVYLHNVVDADSSQLSAIMKAKSGASFVLQGPPGTGKSQTITNLIAEFMYEGKKILFVSEKLAALNVVFNNLKKAELADYCLELHSNKTNKKDVISELYRVLSGNRKVMKENVAHELEELKKVKHQLDEYVETMHTIQPCINKTPYQILGAVSKYHNIPLFEYVIDSIHNKDIEFLKSATENLETFEKYSENVGYDYRKNSWYGYVNGDLTYQNKVETKQTFNKIEEFLKELIRQIKLLKKKTNFDYRTLNAIKNNLELLDTIKDLEFFDTSIYKVETLKELLNAVSNYNKKIKEIESLKKHLSNIFTDDLYEISIKDYYLRFKNDYISAFRFFNGKYRNDKKVLSRYLKDPKNKLKYAEIVNLLKLAKGVQESETNIQKDKKILFNILETHKYSDKEYDWKSIEEELNKISKVLIEDLSNLTSINEKQFNEYQDLINDFVEFIKSSEDLIDNIKELQESFDKDVIDFDDIEVNKLLSKISTCIKEFDLIEDWVRFNDVLNEIKNQDLLEFVDLSIENNIPRKTLSKTFKSMFYIQWMYYIIDKNDILHEFSRLSQDAAVANFKKRDKLRFEISKAEIISKLNNSMPSLSNMAAGSQVSSLVREANKKSKQKPVRLLLRDAGKLIQKLKPCFLMSPLSVSTYLDADTCKFDVIIFDEASQIFPWDAIGSVYRAKQVIVVGDSKQMPPSNFFNAGLNEDEMDDNFYEDDTLDFESILDLCSTVFPQTRLNWHYRSKTEDLISFSNQNFYDGHLVTFPSAHKNNEDTGVDFYYVNNGIFDRKSKCNMIEAEKVVELVFDHFEIHPDRSLGVVAFSISQQEAIEEIIQKCREKDDKYANFFDTKKEEPFFVKNLETVQGDERDTIIFSVAYAKDAEGRFLHNFGPLNKKGGERRLNVAITRAKYNVKLVTSIKSYDIDIGRTSSSGAKLLKDYLDCAEHGMQNLNKYLLVDQDAKPDSYFEIEVCDVLKESGYKVDMQVGCSGYRIDLGVKHPTKGEYVLAVECDGATYHSGKTTRDRDRLRQEVLERLGWKFYRIWSTDWFRNKATEKRKLLSVVEKAIEDFDKNNEIEKDFVVSKEAKIEFFIEEKEIEKKELKSLFKKYEYYDMYKCNRIPSFESTLIPLIEQEQPLHEEQLLKEMVAFFGREKVTNVVRDEFRRRMRNYKNKVHKIGDFY